ncbi:MAG: hypothetical protein EA351_10995 [Gemmatimonadales bacterium]|nr:MAG: hypothetical protein EA351_10995 [Gemmatimonadales bacterium]
MDRRYHAGLIALTGALLLAPTIATAQVAEPTERQTDRRAALMMMQRSMGIGALTLALEHAEYLSLSSEQRTRLEELERHRAEAIEPARAVIEAHREARQAEARERREVIREETEDARSSIRERMQEMDQDRLREERLREARPSPQLRRELQAPDEIQSPDELRAPRMRERAMRPRPGPMMRPGMQRDAAQGMRLQRSRAQAMPMRAALMRMPMPAEVREAHATLLEVQREVTTELREILSDDQLRQLRTLAAVDRAGPVMRQRIMGRETFSMRTPIGPRMAPRMYSGMGPRPLQSRAAPRRPL